MNDKRFQKKLEKIRLKGERQKAKYELESKYAEYYPHREGAKVSNVMLTIIVVIVLVYTIASFALQFHTAVEISPTLTTCIFSFIGIELVSLAGIKVSKIKKEKDKVNDEGDEELCQN